MTVVRPKLQCPPRKASLEPWQVEVRGLDQPPAPFWKSSWYTMRHWRTPSTTTSVARKEEAAGEEVERARLASMVMVPDGLRRMPVSTTSADTRVALTRDEVTVPISASPRTWADPVVMSLADTDPFTAQRGSQGAAASAPRVRGAPVGARSGKSRRCGPRPRAGGARKHCAGVEGKAAAAPFRLDRMLTSPGFLAGPTGAVCVSTATNEVWRDCGACGGDVSGEAGQGAGVAGRPGGAWRQSAHLAGAWGRHGASPQREHRGDGQYSGHGARKAQVPPSARNGTRDIIEGMD